MENKKEKKSMFKKKERIEDLKESEIYTKKDLKGFFLSIKLHFSEFFRLNLLMIACNFPIFFGIAGISDLFHIKYFTPKSPLFANYAGLLIDNNANASIKSVFSSLFSLEVESSAMTTLNWVFIGLTLLVLFTFGISRTGLTYILREFYRGKPVFLKDDFIDTVKKNWKQGLLYGIFDVAILCLIPFNLIFFFFEDSFITSVMFWLMLVIGILYTFMRHFVYLQIVTFKLPLFKILKNALIFSLINIKRNIVAFLGIVILILFNISCFFVTILIPLGIIMFLAVDTVLIAYMGSYASYYKIEEIMVVKKDSKNDSTTVETME